MKEIYIDYSGSKKKLTKCIIEILEGLTFKVNEVYLDEGEVYATKGTSLFSYGEKISIIINELTNKQFEIKIKSHSAGLIQLVDWGTNQENENMISIEINNNLS